MTSNLGSERIQELAGGEYESMKTAVMEIASRHFRPEFINRVDEMVVFHPLDGAQIREIAALQISALGKRLAERELSLEVSDAALDLLASSGFDPVYGARPLKRTIQHMLENALAERLLKGDFVPGDTISIDSEDGALVIGKP
jgi:ATP-dependent Clp protease ATP-binding subunit ClpB